MITKDLQYYKFSAYGFLKNLRFFDPFLLLFLRSVGLSFFQIGLLFSIREISVTVLEVPTGIVADWLGRKSAMIFSFLSYILSFALFYLFSSFALFALAMFLFGIGEAFRTGTHKAMIFDYLRWKNIADQKTAYYGHTRSWSQRGSALSSLIAGALVLLVRNYRVVFLATIFPYILELGLMISYPPELNGLGESSRSGRKGFDWRALVEVLRTAEFRRGILNSAVYDGLFKAVKDYLQPVLRTLALSLPVLLAWQSEQRSAIVIALVYFLIFMLSARASRSSDLFRQRFRNLPVAVNVSFVIGVLLTALVGLFYYGNWTGWAVVLFVSLYVFQNLRRPMNISYISDVIPAQLMATGLSIESQVKTAVIAILAPIIGWLADHFQIGIALAVVAVIVALSFPLYFLRGSNSEPGDIQ